MGLNTEERQNVTYFVGTEVEHTIMRGQRTLFVVGVRPVEEILGTLNKVGRKDIQHIYLGTSQSFNPKTHSDWDAWDKMIMDLLNADFWVTLDFDVKYAEDLHEEGWCEKDRFIPMISVKLPYISLYNYNTTLKIDDLTWGKTNSGVWTHQLHDLMSKQHYTHWDQYTQDSELE